MHISTNFHYYQQLTIPRKQNEFPMAPVEYIKAVITINLNMCLFTVRV